MSQTSTGSFVSRSCGRPGVVSNLLQTVSSSVAVAWSSDSVLCGVGSCVGVGVASAPSVVLPLEPPLICGPHRRPSTPLGRRVISVLRRRRCRFVSSRLDCPSAPLHAMAASFVFVVFVPRRLYVAAAATCSCLPRVARPSVAVLSRFCGAPICVASCFAFGRWRLARPLRLRSCSPLAPPRRIALCCAAASPTRCPGRAL